MINQLYRISGMLIIKRELLALLIFSAMQCNQGHLSHERTNDIPIDSSNNVQPLDQALHLQPLQLDFINQGPEINLQIFNQADAPLSVTELSRAHTTIQSDQTPIVSTPDALNASEEGALEMQATQLDNTGFIITFTTNQFASH